MRHDDLNDQAAGLRRLLARSPARVITVVGARNDLGATSVVVNLAATLAREGREVLVLDEHLTHRNVPNSLGLKARYDLLNVARGDISWHEVLLQAENGVQVLPAARAIQSLPSLDMVERERLLDSLKAMTNDVDVVLVDAAARQGNSVCNSLWGDEPLLLVLNATASGITESYAMLKQMALQSGRQAFDIVLNKVNDEEGARAVFDNMAAVARQHLKVELSYLGYIPVDEKLKRATQLCRSVAEAFPAASSAYAFIGLAQQLMLARETKQGGADLAKVMQRLVRQAPPLNVMRACT